MVVGQPPIKIAKNQQTLVMPTNLDISNNLKENVASNLQADSDKSKEQPWDTEMNHEYNHARFQFTQDPSIIQNSEKVVKKHRMHKYAGKDLLLKRQMRAQEGAKKGRQDALLEKRTGCPTSSFLECARSGWSGFSQSQRTRTFRFRYF